MKTKEQIEEKLHNIDSLLGQSIGLAGGYSRAKEAIKNESYDGYDEQTLVEGAYTMGQKETLEWVLVDKLKIIKNPGC